MLKWPVLPAISLTRYSLFTCSFEQMLRIMKGSRNSANKQSKQGVVNTPRPEIRDDLDSRERKDVSYKDHNNKRGKKSNSRDKNDAGH
jgi:hypothetical protein